MFGLKLRVRIWQTLVRSVALYALEVAVLTKGELRRLERWQTIKLRHLLRQPAHTTHLINYEVRRRCRVFTIESTLLERRLRWWQRVIRPGLEASPPDYDPSLALRATIFGRLSFDGPQSYEKTAR